MIGKVDKPNLNPLRTVNQSPLSQPKPSRNLEDSKELSLDKTLRDSVDVSRSSLRAGEAIDDQKTTNSKANTVEDLLDTPAYRNISDEEAAKMLGYFSKTMRSKGFPWEYKAKIGGKLKDISDLEVLYRLKRGETVYFVPKRNIELSLTGADIEKASKLLGNKPLQNLGNSLKQAESVAKLDDKIGREIPDGDPIPIRSYGELKLLYQLFNPDAKVDEKDPVGKATKALSKFVVEKFSSKYPWYFYSTDKTSFKDKLKKVFSSALSKATIGAAIALAFAGPIGVLLGIFGAELVATGTLAQGIAAITAGGAGVGAVFGIKDGLRDAKLGDDIGPLEALKRIMRGKGVKFQQKRVRSMSVPILGKLMWTTNYREPVEVHNPKELELLKNVYYG